MIFQGEGAIVHPYHISAALQVLSNNAIALARPDARVELMAVVEKASIIEPHSSQSGVESQMVAERITEEFPKLETQNLILRAANLSDAEAIFDIFADKEVTRYHDLEPPTCIEQVNSLINRWAERFSSKRGMRWGIAKKTDNIIIGSCGYSYKSPFSAEIGYELARPYWRKGIMTEALRAVIQFGFGNMELERIQAIVMLENTASMELLKRLGFQEEEVLKEYGYWKGQFYDVRLFSLFKKHYQL